VTIDRADLNIGKEKEMVSRIRHWRPREETGKWTGGNQLQKKQSLSLGGPELGRGVMQEKIEQT